MTKPARWNACVPTKPLLCSSSPPLSHTLFTNQPERASITIVTNPSRPISSTVVRAIVARFTDSLNLSMAAGSLLFSTLAQQKALPTDETALQKLGETWGEAVAHAFTQPRTSRITFVAADEQERPFDPMAYFAPSMAIFALMFTITQGGTTLLAEREQGTLQRMLASPTPLATILAGKIIGLWLAGWAQLAILLSLSALLFDVSWGNPLAVALICFALVVAASGWGVVIAALARTPGEAQTTSIVISLLFGAAAGHFFPRSSLPIWLQQASRISPNAWGLEAFTTLISGGSLTSIVPHVAALLFMAELLFGVATIAARRQFAA
nr:ABC transporter permease [Ardenticatena sp.]